MQKAFWIIPSFVIGFGAQLYTFVFYKEGRPYYAMENAIFGTIHSVLFVIPLACLICISVVSGLGKLSVSGVNSAKNYELGLVDSLRIFSGVLEF